MVKEVGSFFQNESRLQTNSKAGFCWMRKGRQRRLRTPGVNRQGVDFRGTQLLHGPRREGSFSVVRDKQVEGASPWFSRS
jgi:hypothetical protein